MNHEEREIKMIQFLHKIEARLDKLDEIVTLPHIKQTDSTKPIKTTILEDSPLRKNVYELCDGKHTVSDITKSLGKYTATVRQVISKLIYAKMVTEERKRKLDIIGR
jgi:hypothetical protein